MPAACQSLPVTRQLSQCRIISGIAVLSHRSIVLSSTAAALHRAYLLRPTEPMPELPEVEGARRLVERHCVGKHIVKAIVAEDESEWCCVVRCCGVWWCRCLLLTTTAPLPLLRRPLAQALCNTHPSLLCWRS